MTSIYEYIHINLYTYIIMRRLYIIAQKNAYRAFEDYYESLKTSITHLCDIKIIIYGAESDIPLPMNNKDIYLFLSCITPKFYKFYIDGKYRNIYMINTEQSTRPIWSMIIKHYTNKGLTVFDYDQYQTEIAKKTVPNAQIYYLPYQINKSETEHLTSLIMKSKKSYDVAFCATNNSKKRMSLYNQLENRGLKLTDIYGWKGERDQRIAEAKILVNIHHNNDYHIFEHLRCDRWILSGMLVISEESLSDELMDCKDLLIIAKFENIVDKIIEVVMNYEYYYSQYLDHLSIQRENIIKNRRQYLNRFTPDIEKCN